MTLDSNTHPLDELAVYALDALAPEESAAVESHLAGCVACRAELDRHLDTLSQIVTPEAPPADLWDRIASQLPSTGTAGGPPPTTGQVVPFDPERPRHAGRRRRTFASRPATWLAAAAAVVVVVLGATVLSLRSTGESSVSDLAEAAADDPGSTIVQLSTSDGDPQARVVLTDEGTGYVLMDELPTLPEGRSYQLWKMNGSDRPVSLGVIGDGSTEAAAFALPSDTTSLAISEEPDGGVSSPTGPIVADGELA